MHIVGMVAIYMGLAGFFVNADDSSGMVLGVKQAGMFSSLGLDSETAPAIIGISAEYGVCYDLSSRGETDLELLWISIAVHETIEAAVGTRDKRLLSTSIGPTGKLPPGLGDDHLLWGTPESNSGSLWFRRNNVVISLTWRGPWNSMLTLLQGIDNVITNDRQIAPLRAAAESPAILEAGIPAVLAPAEPLAVGPASLTPFQPVFRDLGDPDKLRLRVYREVDGRLQAINHVGGDGFGLGHVIVPSSRPGSNMTSAEPTPGDGRFLLKRGALPPGVHKLVMVAISEDNLIVTREVEITITQ